MVNREFCSPYTYFDRAVHGGFSYDGDRSPKREPEVRETLHHVAVTSDKCDVSFLVRSQVGYRDDFPVTKYWEYAGILFRSTFCTAPRLP